MIDCVDTMGRGRMHKEDEKVLLENSYIRCLELV